MQQLTIEHEDTIEKKKDRREGKGRVLAISRRLYRLQNSDVYYVESESRDNNYYFVKFKPDLLEWYCSCPDNSMRRGSQMKCKHLDAIEYAIRLGTLRDIDRLPTEAKVRKKVILTVKPVAKSYMEDDYSF